MSASFDRRFFLGAGAAGAAGLLIPFPEWLGRFGAAEAAAPTVRPSVATPLGRAMLADYRRAVAAMMSKNAGMPCSWIFQWYIHEVRGDLSKAAAVAALATPQRALANEVWSTCQAHSGRPLRFFLPWHRMYLFFFERIVRQASGNPKFTMPYWNYLSPTQHPLPHAFWADSTDPLFRSNRASTSNQGQPIDIDDPGSFDKGCLEEGAYLPTPGRAGFCGAINGNPHGIVHSLIGNAQGMGTVPWAANDPIFWLHHCNIDRMWASWNKAGRANPTDNNWLDQEFVFADENCNRVAVKVRDFVSTEALGYRYDKLLTVPRSNNAAFVGPERPLRPVGRWLPPPAGPNEFGQPQAIVLGDKPVTVRLTTTENSNAFLSVRAVNRSGEVRLSLSGLRTNLVPGILYDVYVGAPVAKTGSKTRIKVGTITFFDAVVPPEHAQMDAFELPSFYFNITDTVRRLGAGAPIEVTIAPHGQPAEGAIPVIGDIQVFAN